MHLKDYLALLSKDQRHAFAESVGTSAGHLRNVSYGQKPLDPKVCLAIERATRKKVTRRELRPDDCHLIWPDVKAV